VASPKFVKAHALRNYKLAGWQEKIAGRWTYRDLVADPDWYKGWISFDTVTWNPEDKKVYCGLNSLDGDLLYVFDPQNGQFESLGAARWADKFDVKIHRTLLLNPRDHCFYFGTSLLHDLDRHPQPKGGKLVRFDPRSRTFEILCVPVEYLYIQSIAADWERGILYGFTYPAEAVFETSLATRRTRFLAYIGNAIMFVQPHNAVVDKHGWLWGTCAETRAWDEKPGTEPVRLFKYHPDENKFVWFDHGLTRRAAAKQLLDDPGNLSDFRGPLDESRHQQDWGFCDSMAYDGGRYIYAGTVAGVLCRIDTTTGGVEKLANVTTTERLPALTIKDGILYGGGGVKGRTELIRWDLSTDCIQSYSELIDPQMNDRPERIHDIAVDHNHRLYLGENDNHQRSSYLWEIGLE
jgi:hypothetical protein